jgi:hypothetical protein
VGEGLTGKGNDTAFIGGTNGAYNEKNVTTWKQPPTQGSRKTSRILAVGLPLSKRSTSGRSSTARPRKSRTCRSRRHIDRQGVQIGVIAQEIQQVLPACVTENSTGVLSVSTDPLIWYLVNSIKELSVRVKQLEGN